MQTRRSFSIKMDGEKEKRKVTDERRLTDEIESFGKAIDRMNASNVALRKQELEVHEKIRLEEKKDNSKQIKIITEQLARLEAIHQDSITTNKNMIRHPVPHFDGSNLEEWINQIQNCKKANSWTDEKIIEFIPLALVGQASQLFRSFSANEKLTLDNIIEGFKSRLEPKKKSYNRNLFMNAKRNPGESIRAFVIRCTGYILNAEDASSIEKILWAETYLMEKVLQSVSELDRKILQSHGQQDNLESLLQMTDDVVTLDDEFIGNINQKEDACSQRTTSDKEWPNTDSC